MRLTGVELLTITICLVLFPYNTTSFSTTPQSNSEPSIARPPLPGSHPEYPFENVVFQGCGARGSVYGGVAAGLEDLGVLPHLKRFAGTSAGCFPALCMALGLDSTQIQEEMLRLDLTTFFDGFTSKDDSLLKYAGPVYNILQGMGMHPANKITDAIGDILHRYAGNSELTFAQLYLDFGVELCVTVSNLSRGESNFCHMNTTPALQIKDAIRASMSIPFVFQPVKLHGVDDVSVDGGLYNNYPITAFDGWYLSTRPEDHPMLQIGKDNLDCDGTLSALKKSFSRKFEGVNTATIGFRSFDYYSPDNLEYFNGISVDEDGSSKDDEVPLPDTEKARAFFNRVKEEAGVAAKAKIYKKAFAEYLRWTVANFDEIQRHPSQQSKPHPHGISNAARLDLLKKNPPNEDFRPELFGLSTWDEIVSKFDKDNKGYAIRSDISHFRGSYGVHSQELMNRNSLKVHSIEHKALRTILSLQLMQEGHSLSEEQNLARTCFLDCKYIGVLDFDTENADKEYLFQMGESTTKEWCKKRAAELIPEREQIQVSLEQVASQSQGASSSSSVAVARTISKEEVRKISRLGETLMQIFTGQHNATFA
eukprot:CAMPEP_0183705698 /NCGR_PEP_ID=MMETSP0737-20130205/2735_1 /TAXON_ID=385413 /ORGANISM="Thalassiosira miniscula, Strain CCMP1093" /LENGTH=592 /DNA_ID=CAMNT_0025932913 /DNA_START=36 /DNA_END=1811 /DNA_ORIENTATION=-